MRIKTRRVPPAEVKPPHREILKVVCEVLCEWYSEEVLQRLFRGVGITGRRKSGTRKERCRRLLADTFKKGDGPALEKLGLLIQKFMEDRPRGTAHTVWQAKRGRIKTVLSEHNLMYVKGGRIRVRQKKWPSTAVDTLKSVRRPLDTDESGYLQEAVTCAETGCRRAAVIMGWCAAIDRIQKRIRALGFERFNEATKELKAQTKGRFKKWNKEFAVETLFQLREIPESDLLVVLEQMQIFDANQGQRLRTCLQYRNHAAHPGEAPIMEDHVNAFFADIVGIVWNNPKLQGDDSVGDPTETVVLG